MSIKSINKSFSISGPLCRQEIRALAEAGVKTLINVRPDDEEPNQLNHETIKSWAQEAGLRYLFLPVVSGQYSPAAITAFGNFLTSEPVPQHAMCRTGTRALHLWALAGRDQGLSDVEIIAAGSEVGVDLTAILNKYTAIGLQ